MLKLSAKHLILELLMANQPHALMAKEAIAVAALFGINANSVRVALARLSAEQLLSAAQRGQYQLGPNAQSLAEEYQQWRTREQAHCSWQGDYIAVHSRGLGRCDRTALKRRERALAILGFAELEQGLHVRPNNLSLPLPHLHQRLLQLGLEQHAYLFIASQWTSEHQAHLKKLWDIDALHRSYQHTIQTLDAWLTHVEKLSAEDAARESFLLGRQAIHQIFFDPWLPESWLDASLRHQCFERVKAFDQTGHQLWRNLNLAFTSKI